MNNKLMIVATVVATGSAAAVAAGSSSVLLPGYYETRTSSPGSPAGEAVRDCVTASEARERTVERWLAESTNIPNCAFTKRSIGGGRFAFAGSCNNGGMKSSFIQTGTYSPTSLSMNMKMTMNAGGKPISLDLVTTSRRIAAACPAGAR